MTGKEPDYLAWVREQARLIGADGCTRAIELAKDCCLEHDLGYYYGRDPRWAFLYRSWDLAPRVSRRTIDNRLLDCSPLLPWRWPAVRLGGWFIWRRHRKARP